MKQTTKRKAMKVLGTTCLLSLAASLCLSAGIRFSEAKAAQPGYTFSVSGKGSAVYETGTRGDIATKETSADRKNFYASTQGATVVLSEDSVFTVKDLNLPEFTGTPVWGSIKNIYDNDKVAQTALEMVFTPEETGKTYANEFTLEITDGSGTGMSLILRKNGTAWTDIFYKTRTTETKVDLNQPGTFDAVQGETTNYSSLGFRVLYVNDGTNTGFYVYNASSNNVTQQVLPAPSGFDASGVTLRMWFDGLEKEETAVKIYTLGGERVSEFESISSEANEYVLGGEASLTFGTEVKGDLSTKETSAARKTFYETEKGVTVTLGEDAVAEIRNVKIPECNVAVANGQIGSLPSNPRRSQTLLEMVFTPEKTGVKYVNEFALKLTDDAGKEIELIWRKSGGNTLLYYENGAGEKAATLNQQSQLDGAGGLFRIGARIACTENGLWIYDLGANQVNTNKIELPAGFNKENVTLRMRFSGFEAGITESSVKIYTLGGVRLNSTYNYYRYTTDTNGFFPEALQEGETFVPEIYFNDSTTPSAVTVTDVFGVKTEGKIPTFGDYEYLIESEYQGKRYEYSGKVRIPEKRNGQIVDSYEVGFDLYDLVVPDTIAKDQEFNLLPDSFLTHGAKYTFAVSNDKGSVVVENNKFTPDSTGEYTIKVTATSRFNVVSEKEYTVKSLLKYTDCRSDFSSLQIAYKDGADGLVYGNTLSSVSLKGGKLLSGDTEIKGKFVFVAENYAPSYTDDGKLNVLVEFIPETSDVMVDFQTEIEIQVLQAMPAVQPDEDYNTTSLFEGDAVPDNTLKFYDINGNVLEGTMKFEKSVLEAGTAEYKYTFTPSDANYQAVQGSLTFTAERVENNDSSSGSSESSAAPAGCGSAGCGSAIYGGFGIIYAIVFVSLGMILIMRKRSNRNEK